MADLTKRCLLAAMCSISVTSPAVARIAPGQWRSLDLGGLRLDMSLPAVEAFMRARDDMSQPTASFTDEFDCGYLVSEASGADPNNDNVPQTVGTYNFRIANDGYYSVRFRVLPSGTVTNEVNYRESRDIRTWDYYLAEAERIYGKADYVFKGPGQYDGYEAGWCEQAAPKCSHDVYDARLALTYYPHTADQVESGDRLDWRLDAADEALDKQLDDEVTLARSKSPRGKRLIEQCRKRAADRPSESAQDRNVFALITDGMEASLPILDPRKVPVAVFAALGIDRRQYEPGNCFESSDAPIEDSRCKDYYFVAFRWARRMGPSWVVATRTGGVTLADHFYVVGPQRSRRFSKVWWSDTLSGMSAWRKAGARPMVEDKRQAP